MKIDQLLEHYGSAIKIAAAHDYSVTAVKAWISNERVPYAAQCVIEVETKAQFKASKDD